MRKCLTGVLLVVCMTLMSACGSGEPEKEEVTIQQQEGGGTYEEEEMTLPDSLMGENAQGSDYIGNDFSGFVADPQGKPAVYYAGFTKEDGEYAAFVTRWQYGSDKNWISEDLCENSLSEYFNRKSEEVEWTTCVLRDFKRGDNGSLYGVFTYYVHEDMEVEGEVVEVLRPKYSILELDEENDTVFEIPLLDVVAAPLDSWKGKNPWDSELPYITNYHPFEDGSILVLTGESGGGYGLMIDGETGHTMEEMGSVVAGRRRFSFGESELIFFSNDSSLFQVLSLPGLENQNTFGSQMSSDVMGKEWFYYMNPDTWELYLCNGVDVYRAVNYQGSDEMVCITQNTKMEDCITPDVTILDFFVEEGNGFYLCLVETTEEYGVEEKSYRMVHWKPLS